MEHEAKFGLNLTWICPGWCKLRWRHWKCFNLSKELLQFLPPGAKSIENEILNFSQLLWIIYRPDHWNYFLSNKFFAKTLHLVWSVDYPEQQAHCSWKDMLLFRCHCQCCQHHSIHLHCIRFEEKNLKDRYSKSGQIKPKLPSWFDATMYNWENVFL